MLVALQRKPVQSGTPRRAGFGFRREIRPGAARSTAALWAGLRVVFVLSLITLNARAQVGSEPGTSDSRSVVYAPSTRIAFTHPKVEARGVWIPRDSMEPDAKKHETAEQKEYRSIYRRIAAFFLPEGWSAVQ